jgi:hypothetical protein
MLSMLAGRYYLDRSELMEMFVECEGSFDAQSIYHHVTYAVGEAPLLIMESLKYRPGRCDIRRLNPNQLGKPARKDSVSEMYSPLIIASRFEESQCFIDDIIRRDKWLPITQMKRTRLGVVDISWRIACKPRAGVNEDHSDGP